MRSGLKAFSLVSTAVGVLAGCSPEQPAVEATPPPAPADAPGFVTSSACANCHAGIYAEWQTSHHAKAMQHAAPDTVLGEFDGREVEYFDETAAFFRRGEDYVVRTLDAEGQSAEYPVRYTFGVEPIQQYLVEFPGGRLQALPWLWDSRPAEAGGRRWLHLYPDEYVAPGDDLHWTGRRQNWNFMCAECHSTNVVQAYDTRTDTFTTTYDEISIGCEACHGPGEAHLSQVAFGDRSGRLGLTVDLDDRGRTYWEMNPDTGIAQRSEPLMSIPGQPEACGQCHARRATLDEPYRHGLPLADTHRVALLDDGLYFPDGQIRDEVYVYGSFVQSRMYSAGVTCTDCHDPHSGRLVTGPEPNAVCSQCHSPTVFATTDHLGHETDDAGCVDCHMTSRTYMVVDDRRDHSFRVPDPLQSAATGSPDACAACHVDRSPEELDTFIARYRNVPAREGFANALFNARQGHANGELVALFRNRAHPGIARATAIASLRPPFAQADVQAIAAALGDPDPLLRMGGLRAFRALAPGQKARFADAMLNDDLLGVRVEAVDALADAYDYLDSTAKAAFDAAAGEFRRSRLIAASQSEALLSLADFEAKLGNEKQATAAYERALSVEPGFEVARANYVDFLRILGDETRGEVLLREGLELNDRAAMLHHALGLLLVRTARSEQSIVALERAADLDPENARFAYVLGVAQSSLGRRDDALASLAAAYKRHPADFDIAWAYATNLRDAGRKEAARNVATAMEARFPGNADVAALRESLR